ncbi:MAG TPA: gliding motility-associated C-terminal domain-containing protein [Bacteroidales bacterium]|nr:gliding motility-associated C-terminal domain-containing protein [Bacteroidales bacterium]
MAQGEANIWYFGDYGGLDFNSGAAVVIHDGQLTTQEGCSVLCDRHGQLLMYTDGVTIFTKNHTIMQNGMGLYGHSSSTQSAVIAPMPGSLTKFYVFTIDYGLGTYGMNYSVVDIELNNGLGAVVEKNILINPLGTERMTTVIHANKKDFWLITELPETHDFYAYLVSEAGVSNKPVVTTIGDLVKHPGCLKASFDGSIILSPKWESESFEIYSFDNQNGIPFNPISIKGFDSVYGFEFSPDGTKFYTLSYHFKEIYQFDLSVRTKEYIENSAILVGTSSGNWGGALQLAPDGKIYVARQIQWNIGYPTIGVINYPDLSGLACDFVDNAIDLYPGTVRLGLPSFVLNLFSASITYNPDCFGDSTYFQVQSIYEIDSIHWDFGDPASGLNNTSTLLNPFHIFSTPGDFLVSANLYSGVSNINIEINVEIFPSPSIDLGSDTLICGNNPITINAGYGFEIYLWQDGSTDSTYTVIESGLYWVEVTNEYGCSGRDSINVTFVPAPIVELGDDTTLCEGETLRLCANPGFQQYLWQDGSNDSCFMASIGGQYWVKVTDENGCVGGDTINIIFLPLPDVWLGNDTLICFNEPLILYAGEGFESYLWQDGSAGQTYLVTAPGQYWVEVANECGNGADTIIVDLSTPFEIDLGNDTAFCYGHNLVLDPGGGFTNYLWHNGSTNQTMPVYSTGIYWVMVSDSLGCSVTDSIFIELFQSFNFSLGDDTINLCNGDYTFLEGPEGYPGYLWQDGSTLNSILADTEGIYWLEVTDEHGCKARDSVYIRVIVIPENLLGEDIILCPEETITFQAPPGYCLYIWQDGSTGQEFTTYEPGLFWVMVQDNFGCVGSDTILVELFSTPNLEPSQSHWICHGDSILLQVTEGYISYLWPDSSQSSKFWANNEGLYIVMVETICGTFNDSVYLYFHQGHMDLGQDTAIHIGEKVILYPGLGFSDFIWNTGSTDSILYVGEAGIYSLTAFDGYCYIVDSIRVDVFSDIRVPNVFTPNCDGYNDTFFATTSYPDGIFNYKMTIFNRWGRIVHEINSLYEEWDGRINGSDAAEGVYFWICEYQTMDKLRKIVNRTQQGSVTILR